MTVPDRRPAIRQQAWRSRELTWSEKCYLVRLTELPAEPGEDSRRRFGSRGMDYLGFVSLHRDYLARELGCTEGAVRSIQRACIAKGYLAMVSTAVNGLPNRLQAFSGRAVKNGGLRGVENHRPTRGVDEPGRAVNSTALPLETPHQGDHPPESGGSRPQPVVEQRQEETGASESASPAAACEAHGWADCPDHRCAADGRRTA